MSDIYAILFNLALTVIWAAFLCVTLTCRFRMWICLCGHSLGEYACMWIFLQVIPDSFIPVRTVIAAVSLLALTFAFFKDSVWKKIFATGVLLASSILCEMIIALFNEMLLGNHMAFFEQSWQFRVISYFCYIIVMLIFLYGCALFARRGYLRLNRTQMLSFFLFPLSQYVLFAMMGWLIGGAAWSWLYLGLFLSMLFCFSADLFLLRAIRDVAQKSRVEEETRQLARQLRLQYEHYAALTEQYQRIRKLKHDVANHVYTMQLLIQNGKAAQARTYADELLAQDCLNSGPEDMGGDA